MKVAWRYILQKWKRGTGRKKSTIPKDIFPELLKELTAKIEENGGNNLKAGFRKCGIVPLNKMIVLNRLPDANLEREDLEQEKANIDTAFTDMFKELRYSDESQPRKRKRMDIMPGRSVIGADFANANENDNEGENSNAVLIEEPNTSNKKNSISAENYKIGDFVIYMYEGELFPGQVTVPKQRGCRIKSFIKCGRNWKWPETSSEKFIWSKNIKKTISAPLQLKKGVMKIPELKEHWG